MIAEEKRGKLGTDAHDHECVGCLRLFGSLCSYEISPELARYFETEKQLEKEDPTALRNIPSGGLGHAHTGQALH